MSSVTEHTVVANGLTINVAEAGSGPPVLMLHGFPDSWRLWRHQLAALAEAGHRVIAPDLRGFGETDKPGEVADYRRHGPEAAVLVHAVVPGPGRGRAGTARRRLDGVGHGVPVHAPDRLNDLLVEFLGGA